MAFGNRPFKRFKKFNSFGNSQNGYGSSQGTQVKTLYNPFDTSNGQPKWPDAKATYSIGRRHQATSEVTLDDYVIILFPGCVNWCVAIKPHENTPDDTTEVWANHSTNISFNYAFATSPRLAPDATQLPLATALNWEVGLDGFVSWRPVSYALHCQLINTTDRNEGWYEAVRFNRNSLIEPWAVIGGRGSALGNGNYIKGTPHFHNGGLIPDAGALRRINSCNWDEHPSYITGELQDIHNAVFQLNCIKQDNDFQKIQPVKFCTNGWTMYELAQRDDPVNEFEEALYKPKAGIELGWNEEVYTMGASDVTRREDLAGLLSDAMDCIAVRIHATYGTKLLMHSVANQEFLCAENSQMSQYATPCESTLDQLNSYIYVRNARYKYPFHYLASGGHLTVPRPPYS